MFFFPEINNNNTYNGGPTNPFWRGNMQQTQKRKTLFVNKLHCTVTVLKRSSGQLRGGFFYFRQIKAVVVIRSPTTRLYYYCRTEQCSQYYTRRPSYYYLTWNSQTRVHHRVYHLPLVIIYRRCTVLLSSYSHRVITHCAYINIILFINCPRSVLIHYRRHINIMALTVAVPGLTVAHGRIAVPPICDVTTVPFSVTNMLSGFPSSLISAFPGA